MSDNQMNTIGMVFPIDDMSWLLDAAHALANGRGNWDSAKKHLSSKGYKFKTKKEFLQRVAESADHWNRHPRKIQV